MKIGMIPKAREVRLKPKVRKVLEARCRAPTTAQRDVKRARIVLLAAEGRSTRSIAAEVVVQPRIVSHWRRRFAEHGLGGLKDRPRAGKKPMYGKATNKRILVLLEKPPPAGYARCWPRPWPTLMFSMSGASCASTILTLLPASLGARATTPRSWRKPPMWSAFTSIRPPKRLFSVSTKSLRSRPWSGRKAI